MVVFSCWRFVYRWTDEIHEIQEIHEICPNTFQDFSIDYHSFNLNWFSIWSIDVALNIQFVYYLYIYIECCIVYCILLFYLSIFIYISIQIQWFVYKSSTRHKTRASRFSIGCIIRCSCCRTIDTNWPLSCRFESAQLHVRLWTQFTWWTTCQCKYIHSDLYIYSGFTIQCQNNSIEINHSVIKSFPQ